MNAGPQIAQLLLFVVPGETDSLHPLSYSVSSETEGFKFQTSDVFILLVNNQEKRDNFLEAFSNQLSEWSTRALKKHRVLTD